VPQNKFREETGMKKRTLRVYRKSVSIVDESAVSIYKNLGADRIGFLMESTDKENDSYTFMGVDPEALIQSDKNSLVITYSDGTKKIMKGNPLDSLKKFYSSFNVIKSESELEFNGGLVGSLGYDFIRYTEKLPDDNPDEIGIETIQLMLATKFIAIDHNAEVMTAVVLDEDNEEGKARALEAAAELLAKASSGDNKDEGKKEYVHDGVIIKKSDTLDEYTEKVNKIKKYIVDGHIFQTVLSQRWTIQTKRTGLDLYEELRQLNPSPYLYYYNFKEFEIIGSSPEMVVKQVGEKVYTCPIAGTRRRGHDAEEDLKLERELIGDEKERAEHVMLVDLARNDMGRISQIGTVKVTDFMKIQRYSHVMHIVSLVEGKKHGVYHPFDLVSSFLPAGTLSGAPKIRAMEIIDELETVRRGLYGGATGYMSFDGNMNFCITIRTMIKKQDKVYLQAGAGIVADSIPKMEYKECCNKVMVLAKTLVEEENL
jgi:anthranilate synthase component 1